MTKEEVLQALERNRPAFLEKFNCSISDVDIKKGICTMNFEISTEYCHSIDIIQGGFVTSMLDAVSTHALFCTDPSIINVSTIELKVSFYAPSRAGKYKAIGRVEKQGYKTAFLSADLIDATGEKTAVLSATAKIVRAKS